MSETLANYEKQVHKLEDDLVRTRKTSRKAYYCLLIFLGLHLFLLYLVSTKVSATWILWIVLALLWAIVPLQLTWMTRLSLNMVRLTRPGLVLLEGRFKSWDWDGNRVEAAAQPEASTIELLAVEQYGKRFEKSYKNAVIDIYLESAICFISLTAAFIFVAFHIWRRDMPLVVA